MSRRRDADDLRCTATRCRAVVGPGHGVQWLDEKNEWQRYCSKCYSKLFSEKGPPREDLLEGDHDKR